MTTSCYTINLDYGSLKDFCSRLWDYSIIKVNVQHSWCEVMEGLCPVCSFSDNYIVGKKVNGISDSNNKCNLGINFFTELLKTSDI